jgi:hypothetical protein
MHAQEVAAILTANDMNLQVYGGEHPGVTIAVIGIALLRKTQGGYNESKLFYEYAAPGEKLYVKSRLRTQQPSTFAAHAKYDEATPLYEQSLTASLNNPSGVAGEAGGTPA